MVWSRMDRIPKEPSRSAADFIPPTPTLDTLRQAAASCTGCDLYQQATQTVFGEGDAHALVMFVGEQPGDQEDRAGHPFIGPAGRLLDQALSDVGIPRERVYITNAVKHFKWEPMGKRRKHQRPSASEIAACRPWLLEEVHTLLPRIVVCLGATAIQAVFGRTGTITSMRGTFAKSDLAEETFVTTHPSAILRFPEREQQEAAYAEFVKDLKLVARRLHELQKQAG